MSGEKEDRNQNDYHELFRRPANKIGVQDYVLFIVGAIVVVIVTGIILFKRKKRGKWPFNKNK